MVKTNKPKKNNQTNTKRTGNSKKEKQKKEVDHDNIFKCLLTECFEEYITFTQPKLAKELDFSTKKTRGEHVSLIQPFKGKNQNYTVDAAIEIWNKLKEEFMIFHLEAQSYNQKIFPNRMLVYHALVRLKFHPLEVVSHAVCFNQNQENIHNKIKSQHGTSDQSNLCYEYVKIDIYNYHVDNHREDLNPFVIACLGLMDGVKDIKDESLANLKFTAYKNLKDAGIDNTDKNEIVSTFIEAYMQLNDFEESIFNELIQKNGMGEWVMQLAKSNKFTRKIQEDAKKAERVSTQKHDIKVYITSIKDLAQQNPGFQDNIKPMLADEELAKKFKTSTTLIREIKSEINF